jgi:molybdate transport system ATP-binding protein
VAPLREKQETNAMNAPLSGHGGFSMKLRKRLDRFSIELSLHCGPGELVAIVGPSGSGKTTVLRCISGFTHPEEGWMRLRDTMLVDTTSGIRLSPQKRRVGLVNQEYTLFPHMTVLENVAFAHTGGPEPMALLESCGIAHLAEERPGRISGGERQRAALCRVLAMCPRMLLLDEPFSALDVENRLRLREMILDVVKARSIPILHVTHDLSAAVRSADRIVALNLGKEDKPWLERQFRLFDGGDGTERDFPAFPRGKTVIPTAGRQRRKK